LVLIWRVRELHEDGDATPAGDLNAQVNACKSSFIYFIEHHCFDSIDFLGIQQNATPWRDRRPWGTFRQCIRFISFLLES